MKSINDQLEEKLPEGSIEDIGIISDLHIYVYKFMNTEKCSSPKILEVFVKENYLTSPIPDRLKFNVGWSFFSLVPCFDLDLKDHFQNGTLNLWNDYIFKKADNKDQRVEVLFSTIKQRYGLDKPDSEFTVEKVISRGNQDKYCEYTGGGDIKSFQRNKIFYH